MAERLSAEQERSIRIDATTNPLGFPDSGERLAMKMLLAELDATREQAKRVEQERDLLAGIFDQFLCFDLPGNVRVIHVCDDDDKDIWRLIYCDKPRGPEQRPQESYPTALAAIRAAIAKGGGDG